MPVLSIGEDFQQTHQRGYPWVMKSTGRIVEWLVVTIRLCGHLTFSSLQIEGGTDGNP